MPLHPQAQLLVRAAEAAGVIPFDQQTPAEARAAMLAQTATMGRPQPVASVEDRHIAGAQCDLPVRVYTPLGGGPFATLVYFHGGGWVIGSIETHDGLCRALADAAGAIIVSVDYRLAPEHPFPAATEDAYAATCWVADNYARLGARDGRVAVGGDSAGGNLATVVCLLARDRGGPDIAWQLLLYPITDYKLDTASYRDYADGHLLTRDAMAWFWRHYLSGGADREHPYVSPLRAPSLAKLPPALVITAECDPLRDEGEAYARRLAESGVPVTATCYPGMVHGFVRRSRLLDQGCEALDQIGREWRRIMA
jgi:acetyl esterase